MLRLSACTRGTERHRGTFPTECFALGIGQITKHLQRPALHSEPNMTCTQESQRTVRRSASRQGSIYLAVMGVAMIVSIIGMASMQIARLQLKSAGNRQDLEEARLLSQSGVEFGLGNMDFFPNWRTGREMTPPLVVGNGTMTYAFDVDEDSNLTDNTNDPVRLLGIGRVGDAVYATSVLLEAAGGGLTALEVMQIVPGTWRREAY